jgi:hypothetical protein
MTLSSTPRSCDVFDINVNILSCFLYHHRLLSHYKSPKFENPINVQLDQSISVRPKADSDGDVTHEAATINNQLSYCEAGICAQSPQQSEGQSAPRLPWLQRRRQMSHLRKRFCLHHPLARGTVR